MGRGAEAEVGVGKLGSEDGGKVDAIDDELSMELVERTQGGATREERTQRVWWERRSFAGSKKTLGGSCSH